VHAVGTGTYGISLQLKWISSGAVNNLVWQGMPIAVSWYMWMTFFSAATKVTGSVFFWPNLQPSSRSAAQCLVVTIQRFAF
jgi:hypothetical protein